ncbi:MAG: zf-HC2 domain-containing protein [Syntrophomonas sp.]
MNCITAGELLSPFLDGELSREEEIRLAEHLEGCPACRCELDEIKQVVTALNCLGKREIAAPSGFSSVLMARINEEKAASKNRLRQLKKAAAGAAAVLLLTVGAAALRPEPAGQIAQAPSVQESSPANQVQTGSSNQQSPGDGSAIENNQHNTSPSDNPNVDAAKPADNNQNQRSSSASGGSGPVEFTGDKEYVIVSTFIKVKVDNSEAAEETARALVNDYGAQMQSLGQQTVNGKLCLVEKIVVSNFEAQNLAKNLSALGSLVSHEEQKADITQRYSELYDQYIALKSELAQTKDNTSQLEQQIKQAEKQLRALEQQSNTQTIVLWLQQ